MVAAGLRGHKRDMHRRVTMGDPLSDAYPVTPTDSSCATVPEVPGNEKGNGNGR
jgi:hypothetical protein